MQFSNAELPMNMTLPGMTTFVNLLQLLKAFFPMLVTPSGMMASVRLGDHVNCSSSMKVRFSGSSNAPERSRGGMFWGVPSHHADMAKKRNIFI